MIITLSPQNNSIDTIYQASGSKENLGLVHNCFITTFGWNMFEGQIVEEAEDIYKFSPRMDEIYNATKNELDRVFKPHKK